MGYPYLCVVTLRMVVRGTVLIANKILEGTGNVHVADRDDRTNSQIGSQKKKIRISES